MCFHRFLHRFQHLLRCCSVCELLLLIVLSYIAAIFDKYYFSHRLTMIGSFFRILLLFKSIFLFSFSSNPTMNMYSITWFIQSLRYNFKERKKNLFANTINCNGVNKNAEYFQCPSQTNIVPTPPLSPIIC